MNVLFGPRGSVLLKAMRCLIAAPLHLQREALLGGGILSEGACTAPPSIKAWAAVAGNEQSFLLLKETRQTSPFLLKFSFIIRCHYISSSMTMVTLSCVEKKKLM